MMHSSSDPTSLIILFSLHFLTCRKCVRILLILSNLLLGNLACIKLVSRIIPKYSRHSDGPTVLWGGKGIPKSWKAWSRICLIYNPSEPGSERIRKSSKRCNAGDKWYLFSRIQLIAKARTSKMLGLDLLPKTSCVKKYNLLSKFTPWKGHKSCWIGSNLKASLMSVLFKLYPLQTV